MRALRLSERSKKDQESFARLAAKHREHKGTELCNSCDRLSEPGKEHCYEHLNYYRRYHKERRKKLKAQGICSCCGQRKAIEGKTRCRRCIISYKVWARKRTRIHHSSRKTCFPGAHRFSDNWNEVDCIRCLNAAGIEV